jgi:hypothetical protein
MLSCHNTTRLISDGLDRPLSLTERLYLGLHLLLCPPCHRFHRATRWLHDALAALCPDARLPDEARDRIRQTLERAAGHE